MKKNIFELEYSKKFPFIKISWAHLFSIFFIAVFTGIMAFLMETLLDYFTLNYLLDRGFLIGPFLPIYFSIVFFSLLLIKTPRITLKNFILYVVIIGAIISLVEFIIGNIFELIIKHPLWTYDGFVPLSYKYVSLTVAVFWGVLGTFYISVIVPIIKKLADKIPNWGKITIVVIFLILFITDLIITNILIYKNGGVYRELYYFEASKEITLVIFLFLTYLISVFVLGYLINKLIKNYLPLINISYIFISFIPLFSLLNFFISFESLILIGFSFIGEVVLILNYILTFILGTFFIFTKLKNNIVKKTSKRSNKE